MIGKKYIKIYGSDGEEVASVSGTRDLVHKVCKVEGHPSFAEATEGQAGHPQKGQVRSTVRFLHHLVIPDKRSAIRDLSF